MHCGDHINILLMPTDACNMHCTYCFHKAHRDGYDVMALSTFKKILDITTPFYKQVNLIWHGGEPLLLGLDFYREAVGLQKMASCIIHNSIQSNLTLMTEDYAKFFHDHGFKVSGSYDGVRNDALRGNSEKIMEGRQLVLNQGDRCGLIMVVSNGNIETLIDSYLYFKKINVNISLNLFLNQRDCVNNALKLDSEHTIKRLNSLFDYWAMDVENPISISYFKHILDYIAEQKKSLCTYTSCLGRWIGVRYDGEIVPCNRYFPNEYSFGNIFDYSDIGQAFDSEGFKRLVTGAIARREKCKSCKIYDFCCGGCNNNAYNENGIENNDGFTCKVLQGVYQHIEDFIHKHFEHGVDKQIYNPILSTQFQKV